MDEEGTINLRGEEVKDEAEFEIKHVEDADQEVIGKVEAAHVSELEQAALKPYDKVKVKFDKFVNLVASHAYEDIFEKHRDEDVILSTDLLTDLANAHEEKESNRVPLIFVVGIVLGVVITWIILRT